MSGALEPQQRALLQTLLGDAAAAEGEAAIGQAYEDFRHRFDRLRDAFGLVSGELQKEGTPNG